MKLLLIEDCNTVADYIEWMVEIRNGFAITRATTLEEACDTYQDQYFDVILLSLQLSDSDGIDTYLEMKKNIKGPTIILSKSDNIKVALSAISHGAQDFLVKGKFDVDDLYKSIYYAIQRHKRAVSFEKSMLNLKNSVSEIQKYKVTS